MRRTLAGIPWDFKLVHETTELLSHSHGPQETLVIEKMFLTPLGVLLVLQDIWGGEKEKSLTAFIRLSFSRLCKFTSHQVPVAKLAMHTLYLNECFIHIQHSEVVSLSNCEFPVLTGLQGETAKDGIVSHGYAKLTKHFSQKHSILLFKASFHSQQLSFDWVARGIYSESASLLLW